MSNSFSRSMIISPIFISRPLALRRFLHILLDRVNNRVEFGRGVPDVFTSAQQTSHDLLRSKGFAPSVLLMTSKESHRFVRKEVNLRSHLKHSRRRRSPHLRGLTGRPPVFEITTEWTFHRFCLTNKIQLNDLAGSIRAAAAFISLCVRDRLRQNVVIFHSMFHVLATLTFRKRVTFMSPRMT